MKTLLLIRHAKSDWTNTDSSDFDRSLNDRGKRDAPAMAQRLLDRKIRIDAFVSSPAKRARKTAEIFAWAYGRKKEEIALIDELYLAAPEFFYKTVSNLDNKLKQVAIFSHNPGITEFANSLTDTRVDDMPTTSIFAVQFEGSWMDFREADKQFFFFDYPKAV